jgi:hypothetical protein
MRNWGIGPIRKLVDVLQGGYPLRIRKLLVLNAPVVFAACWKMVRPLLATDLSEKISFVTTADLPKFFTVENLPLQYGGKLDLEANLVEFIKHRCRVEKVAYDGPHLVFDPKLGRSVMQG